MTFEEQVARGEYIHEVNKALTILKSVRKLGGKGVSTEEREAVTKAVSDIEEAFTTKVTNGSPIIKFNRGEGKTVVVSVKGYGVPFTVDLDELEAKGTLAVAF